MDKGIIFYSDNRLNENVAKLVRNQLIKISQDKDIPIVSCSLQPIDLGKNIVLEGKRGHEMMFKQILTALENSDAQYIYHCEHDNIYHPSHFDFTPPRKDRFYYDLNWWKIHDDGYVVHWEAAQVSGLCYYRQLGIDFYRKRLETYNPDSFDRKFEPTVEGEYETWWAEYPSLDIRHKCNLTYNKRTIAHFRNKSAAVTLKTTTIDKIEGWSNLTLKDIYG